MRRDQITEAIRNAAWANPTGLRTTEGAAELADTIMDIVGPVSSEPHGVTIAEGDTLRDEREWTVLDRGQFRTLRLRVGRGVLDPPERDDGPRAA